MGRARGKLKRPDACDAAGLPGITCGNPTAGGAELIAVDERGVDLTQARGWGEVQFLRGWPRIRPKQPLDRLGDIVPAGGRFDRGEGNLGRDELEQKIAFDQR